MSRRTAFSDHLVEQAQAGDAAAREHLLRDLQPLLRAYFMDRVGYRTEVDDLIQNTLLRVHNALGDLKDPRRFKAFTMKAALFELQDLYRGRYSAKERLYDPDHPPGYVQDEGAGSTRIDLERAMGVLTPKAQQILELRESGYRYEEIAQMIGSTEAAIKMQVKRAFEKLRRVLAAVLALLLLG